MWQIKLTEALAATIQIIKYSDLAFLLYKNIAYKIPDNPIFKSKRGLKLAPVGKSKNPSIFVKNPAANATAGPNKKAIVDKNTNPNLISKPITSGIFIKPLPITVKATSAAVKDIVLTFLKFAAISEIPNTSKIFLIKITPENKYFLI